MQIPALFDLSQIGWGTPAGKVLKQLIQVLNDRRMSAKITLFGSASLQISIAPQLLSNDVDFFADQDLESIIRELGLLKSQSPFYLEQTPPDVFRTCRDWIFRAQTLVKGSVELIIPHPLDILVSKIKRLEEKDLNAFLVVKKLTDHPTEVELKYLLQQALDIFRPGFDEENPGGDPIHNTQRLWQTLFPSEIDVRKEIIIPAVMALKIAYGEGVPDRKSELNRRADLKGLKPDNPSSK